MYDQTVLNKLGRDLKKELSENILPYWENNVIDTQNGGFVGRITHDNSIDDTASKGLIMNARLLWTYSAIYRRFRRKILKELADRAYSYILSHFFDSTHGGFYWMLDPEGKVQDDRKHLYAQAFTIYAFTEYFMAFKCRTALDVANDLYRLVEVKCSDPKNNGYFEAFSRDWQLHDDARLSEKDINEPKSMNTHLHLLEAYTNLYRCDKSTDLQVKLRSLIEVLLDHIVADDGTHLVNFLNEDWEPRSNIISFGHDIESVWLLQEASEVIGDKVLNTRVIEVGTIISRAVLQNGLDKSGGLLTEADHSGITNDDKEWWPQAEALVGFLNTYENTGDPAFLDGAVAIWEFVQKFIVDSAHGDWIARVSREGNPFNDDKARDWKCSYHNSRACLEVMHRTKRMVKKSKIMRSSVKPST